MKNIRDLTEIVASKNNLDEKEVMPIIQSTFEEISNILINEREEVRIKNFGVFRFSMVPSKNTKHPVSKLPIVTGDKLTVRLGVSKKIKDGLNHA